MLLICDYCGVISKQIFKLPSSAFYVKDATLFCSHDFISMCADCLAQKEKES